MNFVSPGRAPVRDKPSELPVYFIGFLFFFYADTEGDGENVDEQSDGTNEHCFAECFTGQGDEHKTSAGQP